MLKFSNFFIFGNYKRFDIINTSHKRNNIFSYKKYFSNKVGTNKISSIPATTSKQKEETLFLFSHDTARKYYKLNVFPLLGYLVVSGACLFDSDYPDYLRNTMYLFMGSSMLVLTGISIYAKRHVHTLKLVKPSNILLVSTFSKSGFGKDRLYQVPIKDILEMIPISKYIGTKSTGIYILKANQNTKYFPFMNFFFIRPKSGIEFDAIFKNKIKK
jgi:hypothetical protein